MSDPSPRPRLPGRPDEPASSTRWIGLFVSVILVGGFALLWIPPGRTADLWAWTIRPDMTPLFMGSAYGAGAYFFARAWRTPRWHRVSAGFPGIAIFAGLMFAATLVHWDRFNHGDAPVVAAIVFYGWTIVYALSPFLVGWAWLRNRRTDDGAPEPADAVVPGSMRLLVGAGGVVAVGLGVLLYAAPGAAIDHWPWDVSPLTARVLASFVVEGGVIAVALAMDARWSAWRILVQTAAIGSVLMLIGTGRAWDDWDGGVVTWLFLAGLIGAAVGSPALLAAMHRRVRAR